MEVTRSSLNTWEVRTPSPAVPWIGEGAPPVNYTAGDLSVLLKEAKGKLTPVALYHMPFGLTVTCLNNACPVPPPQ